MIENWEGGKVRDIKESKTERLSSCSACGSRTGVRVYKNVNRKRLGVGADAFKVQDIALCSQCMTNYIPCKECGAISTNGDSMVDAINRTDTRGRGDATAHLCGVCAWKSLGGHRTKVMLCPGCNRHMIGENMAFMHNKKIRTDRTPATWLPNGVKDDGFYLCARCTTRVKECGMCKVFAPEVQRVHCRANVKDKHPSNVDICHSCAQSLTPEKHEFNYVPDLHFMSHEVGLCTENKDIMEHPFMGVELEMDCGTRGPEMVNYIRKKGEQVMYIKHDGSLGPLGIELVTHPATMRYHLESMGWSALLAKARECGYVSWNATNSCGLHVHVGRWAFDSGQKTFNRPRGNDVLALEILAAFYGRNAKQVAVLSGRENEQYSAMSPFMEGIIPSRDIEISNNDRGGHGHGRYWAVNFTNKFTIEFRHFRGSLRHDTIMMAISWAQMMAIFCRDVAEHAREGIYDPTRLRWDRLCGFIREKTMDNVPGSDLLVDELDRRGLFWTTAMESDRWSAKHESKCLTDVVYEEQMEHTGVSKDEIDSNVAKA